MNQNVLTKVSERKQIVFHWMYMASHISHNYKGLYVYADDVHSITSLMYRNVRNA